MIKDFDSKSMYTVHSFQFIAENKSHEIGHYHYGGNKITSIVKKDNVLGVQFHPEKSGYAGLSFINSIFNFCSQVFQIYSNSFHLMPTTNLSLMENKEQRYK